MGMRALPLTFVLALVLGANSSEAQSWLETRAEIERLIDDGKPAAALELAPELLRLGSEEFGDLSEQLAESHLLAAGVQMANSDYTAAEASVLAAIDIHMNNHGPLSTRLIGPYITLGDAFYAGDAPELALGAYNEARAIGRRTYGLRNAGQIPILYRMADSTEALGDVDGAIELLFEAIDLVQQSFGPGSQELIEAVYGLAAWLIERDFHTAAGNQYRAAAFTFSLPPLETVRILRLAAEQFRLAAGDLIDRNGPRAPTELLSALRIVEGLPSEPGLELLRAQILLDIADWHVVFDNKFEIEQAYARVWDAVSRLENGDEIRQTWFSATVPLYLGSFRSRVLSSADDALPGRVEMRFLVDTNGTADDIEVIAADPPGLVDSAARRRVNLSRFRPGIEGGVLVPMIRVISFDFGYDPRFADGSDRD